MTLTPGPRWLLVLAGPPLLVLGLWALLDGPLIREDTAVTGPATEPSVQCSRAMSGPEADYDEAGCAVVTDDPAVLTALDADDVVHEGEDLPTPSDPATSPDPAQTEAANDVLAVLCDKIDRCDRTRIQRTSLALLAGLPGVLLLAVGLTIGSRPAQPRPGGGGRPWPGKDGF